MTPYEATRQIVGRKAFGALEDGVLLHIRRDGYWQIWYIEDPNAKTPGYGPALWSAKSDLPHPPLEAFELVSESEEETHDRLGDPTGFPVESRYRLKKGSVDVG